MFPTLKVPKHILPLTDDELFQLCASNSELLIERNANGELIIMSPAGGLTGIRNSRLILELGIWNEKTKLGYVFDSSTGFVLPDKSMMAPDASWIEKSRWQALSVATQEKFPPMCPDFVIELKSPSDDLNYVTDKMLLWMKNGCRLAWFINPEQRQATVYRSAENISTYSFDETLSGEVILPGFTLELKKLL
ncbi:Uma2 family endonuclease [Oscillatoria amoena NRMC-F 0135]|jgi:Uma2 family endonuclease|nr:Uma2 family endonuclease [Oscillatoria amoena NRMC-F 0135]